MSSQHHNRPDLEETINVTSAHNPAVTNAAARENRNPGIDKEPLSIATFGLIFLIILTGGAVLGNTQGHLLNYQKNIKSGYTRSGGGADEVVLPPKPILAAYIKKGQSLYSAKCNGCHGADAKGDGANYPSLAGSEWVTGSSERFSQIILNGLQGPVSTGKSFGIMPAQGGGMSPEDLAYLMTFIRNSFGNSVGDVISPEMAKAAIEISAKRAAAGTAVSADELKAHDKSLPGDKVDPAIMVDPLTMKPVAAAPATPPAP